MIGRALKAVGRAYLNSVLWFAIGAVGASVQSFILLSAIYHAGVCR